MSNARNDFGSVLRMLRVREAMPQGELARKLGLHRNTVGSWERGDYLPSLTTVHQVADILYLDEHDTSQLFQAHSARNLLAPPWNIPYLRNPYFTGREEMLQRMCDVLQRPGDQGAMYALTGLGGIGKTQIALEYAYRFRHTHKAIFWLQADSYETLVSDYLAIADTLDLPEKNVQDQTQIVKGVIRWFNTHTGWLLIYDNVDHFEPVQPVLPTSHHGSILLTTRLQALGGIFQLAKITAFSSDEALSFLLHRGNILSYDQPVSQANLADQEAASTIAESLGCLPLALDQAAAYIEEHGCSLFDYLTLYQQNRARLLSERGNFRLDHPRPVATTFALAFEDVQRQNPAAADLLRFCVFLAPDAIPQALLTCGTIDLGPHLQPLVGDQFALHVAFKDLLRFSLIQRNVQTQTFSIHRLVAVVLRQSMERTEQRTWLTRAVSSINQAFPMGDIDIPVEHWAQCELLLPHACHCIELSTEWGDTFPAIVPLLRKTADYIQMRAHYTKARQFYLQALALCEQEQSFLHGQAAACLLGLALLTYTQGDYNQAEQLCQRVIAIREQEGEDAAVPQKIRCTVLLGVLYWSQTRYAEAQPLCEWALHKSEQEANPSMATVATCLMVLASIYKHQKRSTEAESLGLRACALYEQTLGPSHPHVATALIVLSALYRQQGRYDEALPPGQRAVRICEQVAGPTHPSTAISLTTLALLYREQGRYREAENLCDRALAIREQVLGPTHPHTVSSLAALALLYNDQGRTEEAKTFLQRVQTIIQQTPGNVLPLTQELLQQMS